MIISGLILYIASELSVEEIILLFKSLKTFTGILVGQSDVNHRKNMNGSQQNFITAEHGVYKITSNMEFENVDLTRSYECPRVPASTKLGEDNCKISDKKTTLIIV